MKKIFNKFIKYIDTDAGIDLYKKKCKANALNSI